MYMHLYSDIKELDIFDKSGNCKTIKYKSNIELIMIIVKSIFKKG